MQIWVELRMAKADPATAKGDSTTMKANSATEKANLSSMKGDQEQRRQIKPLSDKDLGMVKEIWAG